MNLNEQEVTFVEPVFAPWDGRRVPVVLLSGYLGAGKTTLLNELLARTDVPIAVFVNDVGQVNIDARLIERQHGDTLDLTGGCVCCSLKNGFLEAFDELRQRPEPPELVIVEMSGIADPARAIGACNTPGFGVDGVVVLVDADAFPDQVSAESVMGDAVRAQVAAADLLLLTKCDLVDEQQVDAVRASLSELVPDVPVIRADSSFSAAGLVGLAARRPVAQLDAGMSLFDQHQTEIIPMPGTIDRADLQAILDGFGDDVVRAKGIVQIETGELLLVQVVGRRHTVEPLPMAELTEPTDLVVIRA